MASTFRLKAQTVNGIDVDAPVAQAADIASLINATSFTVDIIANSAQFTIGVAVQIITVTYGQVVSIKDGVVTVQDRAAFYELYEGV